MKVTPIVTMVIGFADDGHFCHESGRVQGLATKVTRFNVTWGLAGAVVLWEPSVHRPFRDAKIKWLAFGMLSQSGWVSGLTTKMTNCKLLVANVTGAAVLWEPGVHGPFRDAALEILRHLLRCPLILSSFYISFGYVLSHYSFHSKMNYSCIFYKGFLFELLQVLALSLCSSQAGLLIEYT